MECEDQEVDPLTAQLHSVSQPHNDRPVTGAGSQIHKIVHEESPVIAVGPVVLSIAVSALMTNVQYQPPDRNFDPEPNAQESDVLTGAELDPVLLSLQVVPPNSPSLHQPRKSIS